MNVFNESDLKKLYIPPKGAHKGQNGKLTIIGGSHLFHGASLWALKVASRIVDMVFYSSVSENNEIVQRLKEEFRDAIVVPRDQLGSYIDEADCILIGPGLPRREGQEEGDDDTKELTQTLLKKYSDKKWVIDGGSLQTIDPSFIPQNAILTPHPTEFQMLFGIAAASKSVAQKAKAHNCIILLKGQKDTVCSQEQCVEVKGGNTGMTKGGTGDVLAGLVAALACKNDMFLAASAGSFINKKAGEALFKKVGPYFNASDLADEIPRMMANLLGL